ncbi:MAG: hypothetical protein KC543_09420, partial [Myxococcales bacterium]|nr:hypothetical protein [Myxococcales bacterium]
LATQPSPAAIVAARRGPRAPWEPLFARYDAPRVLPALDAALAEGVRSFQALFGRLEVEPARGIDPAALTDWDAPDDVAR